MTNSSTSYRAALEEAARRGIKLPRESGLPLWPAPYNEDSPEALKAFLFDCLRTWNEAEQEVQPIARLPHLEAYADIWWETRSKGEVTPRRGLLRVPTLLLSRIEWSYRASHRAGSLVR